MSDILEIIERQRLALLRRDMATVRELETVYNASLDKLEVKALRAVSVQSQGTLAVYVKQDQLVSLIDSVQSELRRLSDVAERLIAPEIRLRVIKAAEDFAALARDLGYLPSEVNPQAVQRIAALSVPESPLTRLLTRNVIGSVSAAQLAITTGVATGQNPLETARDLRKVLNVSKYSAQRIARTETLRAYRGAMRDNYQRSGWVAGWRWIAALDKRTCAFCWAQHGTVHEATETMATHPSCRCSQAPMSVDTRVRVPSGESQFADLSAARQREILGPAKFEAYQAGRIELSDLVGFRNHPDWGPSGYQKSLREALAA